MLILPNQSMSQTNPDFNNTTKVKVKDANFSLVTIFFYFTCPFKWSIGLFIFITQDEHRAIHPKYSMPLFPKVPTLQWRIRVVRNARVQKMSCNLNVGPSFYFSRTSLAVLLTLIIQLCDWRLISPSSQRTAFHIFSVILIHLF